MSLAAHWKELDLYASIKIICLRLEFLVDYICGWWLPLYGTLRFLTVLVFLFLHKQVRSLALFSWRLDDSCAPKTSEAAFAAFIVPCLKPYERVLDTVLYVSSEVLDISTYIIGSLLWLLWSPFQQIYRKILQLQQRVRLLLTNKTAISTDSVSNDASDGAIVTKEAKECLPRKTPRPRKVAKPRFSQIARPHMPGHLVAEGVSFPPIQTRLQPAERSYDQLPDFRDAMDRAQAAFYEAESPVRRKRSPHADIQSVNSTDAVLVLREGEEDASTLTLPRPSRKRPTTERPPEGMTSSPKRRRTVPNNTSVEKGQHSKASKALMKLPTTSAVGKRKATVIAKEAEYISPATRVTRTRVEIPSRAEDIPIAACAPATTTSRSNGTRPPVPVALSGTAKAHGAVAVTRETQAARHAALAARKQQVKQSAAADTASAVTKRKKRS